MASPTTSTPVWSAPHNGLVGDASATNGAGQINQLLGAHGIQAVYQGQQIVTPEYIYAASASPWNTALATEDVDQPFTMSGTVIGRVQVPILPVGAGADLLASLWTDNGSGQPGTMICQSRIPAAQLLQLAAVAGYSQPSNLAPATYLTGNTLAVPQQQAWGFSDQTIGPYNYPAVTFVGIAADPSTASYGGYIVIIGGVTNDTALSGVYTMQYTGARQLLPTQPQPSFPTGNDGSSSTCIVLDSQTGGPVVVNTGGGTSYEGAPVAAVYTSSLDATAGTLSAWSAQAALPAAVQNHTMASWNGYVYSVAGRNTGGLLNTINYAQVANGQISAWTATTPVPIAMQLAFVAATNGFLVVAGGANAAFTGSTNVWYAPIQANGALGAWSAGPPLAAAAYNNGASPAFANSYGVLMDTNANSLTFTASGPSSTWTQDLVGGSGALPGFWDLGNGSVIAYALAPNESLVGIAYDNLMPYPSIPLPATGLSTGATYHLTLQQQGGDLGDYLVTSIGPNIFSASGPTALTSPRAGYTWTAQTTGNAVPIAVFNNTPPSGALPQMPWHLWDDSGAKITTLLNATTPDQRLLGVCEATRQAVALNANTGFEAGISPWTVFGGTVAQSSTEAYTGSYSAQVTPSGSASQAFLDSEMLPCVPGQSVTVTGWVWATNAITANFSLSVNWYTLTGTLISTSSNSVSIPAATWTQVTNTFTAATTGTLPYQFTINPTLGGTPAAGQIWYLDACHAHYTYTGPQNSTVTAINWPSAYPNPGLPSGTTQLA